jgi:excisionase family DNA binding protein
MAKEAKGPQASPAPPAPFPQQAGPPAPATFRILSARWDERDTFGVAEAGEILGLSRQAAYDAAKSGDLPTIRVGRRLIVPRIALERLLTSAGHPA